MATQPEFEHPKKAFGWAARDPTGVFSPFNFSRRETGEKDVAFKILYLISTSPNKEKEAIEHLGAESFLLSRNVNQMKAAIGTLDAIIDTVSADHPLLPLIGLLKSYGKLVMVGAVVKPLELPVYALLEGRKLIAGSNIGGIKETQEMIDFAAQHDVKPDIEIVPIDYVNTAMERLAKADVKFRFVIDIGNTLKPSS
ncbi:unnamed protein product [Vicia faba]|uniref:Alcohol dehydrogenase-like C-terminal domain-containing protein n=1 Tax=Vicia faba TaxID=3906 RepID=A0AAV0ZA67_VICFA|nr:unnamed protein product [Vicia faba]